MAKCFSFNSVLRAVDCQWPSIVSLLYHSAIDHKGFALCCASDLKSYIMFHC